MTFDEFWKHYVGGDKDKSLETGRIYAASAWDYQQARIEALESLLRDVHDDLLLRAVTDTQGHKVVAVGFSIWERMKKLLELERREKILHESLECGHDLVEEQPCAQCRLEARIEALEAWKRRAMVLLNDATYHDGRYDQHTSREWQKEACALLREEE